MHETHTVYLAPAGYEHQLATEMRRRAVAVLWQRGRLFGSAEAPLPLAWAQNVWYTPQFIPVDSIGDAAAKLRAVQRNWALAPHDFFRRAALIQEKLPVIGRKPFVFGEQPPDLPMGGWTLWDENTILAAARTSSPFPNGEITFAENTEDPPSRAYLKLWDVFTVTGIRPSPGDVCLDLGSAPGGWTWVLATLGARVFSLDKAELDPRVAALPTVNHCAKSSAFGLEPHLAGKIDWLFCDVACYPARLWSMVERWLEKGECANFVCTLKFQGETDHETAERFASVPGSRLVHLSHNKHELTWVLTRSSAV
ncbi:MAG: Ribosomal RNA large subunit methyltransferase M [Desulfovibrio sp.]